jgi:hypothetical protein
MAKEFGKGVPGEGKSKGKIISARFMEMYGIVELIAPHIINKDICWG